jgi:CheY-like chemotaxis protein
VRIHQILTNLLHNAAKYTDPGGRISAIVQRDGDGVVIRVRDNGIGMEPAILTGIFDLFTQAPQSLDRARGGLGIGLTLVRSLIELHGGSITAHSAGPGQGSEFVVRLPVREPADRPRTAADGAAAAAGPRQILLIDDDRLGSELLVRVLQFWGHSVTVVHDGATALEAFRSGRPDLVLCDLGLPEMDGFAVARALRRQASEWPDSQPRLVALTGYGQDEDRRRSLDAGFDHHLTKPVDLAVLRELLGGPRRACPADD